MLSDIRGPLPQKNILDIAMEIGYATCELLFYGWLCLPAELENQTLMA